MIIIIISFFYLHTIFFPTYSFSIFTRRGVRFHSLSYLSILSLIYCMIIIIISFFYLHTIFSLIYCIIIIFFFSYFHRKWCSIPHQFNFYLSFVYNYFCNILFSNVLEFDSSSLLFLSLLLIYCMIIIAIEFSYLHMSWCLSPHRFYFYLSFF